MGRSEPVETSASAHRVLLREPVAEAAVGAWLLWWCHERTVLDETVLPTTGGMVVLVVGGGQGPELTLRRSDSRPSLVRGVADRRSIGVLLRPGTWWLAHELSAIFGGTGGDGGRRVIGPGRRWQAETALGRVEAVVAELVAAGRRPSPLVGWAEAELRSGARVGEVCAALQIDRRRLAAAFVTTYGVGLKRYGRLCRFERAVALLRRSDAPPLAVVAAETGFTDQSHLCRELRAIGGLRPSQLHRRAGPSPTHLPHDETSKTSPS